MSHINFSLYDQSWVLPGFPPPIPAADSDTIRIAKERDSARDSLRAAFLRIEHLEHALSEIANSQMGCGCMPCMGQCRSATAYELELDSIRNAAAYALKVTP